MAIPQSPMLTLAHPARPMPRPATNGFLRMNSRPATANITASASLCAPATTAQINSGLAIVSNAARPCRRGSPCASISTPAQAKMNGTTENTCSQNTMSCMFSPPSLLATSCVQEVIGPYTLGVSCHGRSVQRSTGSNCPRNTSAGVIS